MDSKDRAPKLLDQVRTAIRMRHYSRRTEDACPLDPNLHRVSRQVASGTLGVADVSAFVSWLAEQRRVSASTQNQALSAVLFLYLAVLGVTR